MLIGDHPLTPEAIVRAARAEVAQAACSPAARARIEAAHSAVAASERPVYGRTTGVGANRAVSVSAGDEREHSLRLLRSHAGGVGERLADEVTRTTILIRLAQLAAGGSGISWAAVDALAGLLADPPALHDRGGIGTGDLAILAELSLSLPESAIGPGDGLALISSNAVTLAVAALAWHDLRELADAGLAVAALSFTVLRGNAEAFAASVAAARPLPALERVCARLRALVGESGAARIQDPFALRCLPQVAAAAESAIDDLGDLLAIEINAAAENPLVADGAIYHHGGFHLASLALALDRVRLALVGFATLAAKRITHLAEPTLTGRPAFLAEPGGSGIMIAEYLAGDTLARLRHAATPTVTGDLTIARGLEEHASFGWQAALLTRTTVGELRTLLALELLAAERALSDVLPADAPLAPDLHRALARLPALAATARAQTATGRSSS